MKADFLRNSKQVLMTLEPYDLLTEIATAFRFAEGVGYAILIKQPSSEIVRSFLSSLRNVTVISVKEFDSMVESSADALY